MEPTLGFCETVRACRKEEDRLVFAKLYIYTRTILVHSTVGNRNIPVLIYDVLHEFTQGNGEVSPASEAVGQS